MKWSQEGCEDRLFRGPQGGRILRMGRRISPLTKDFRCRRHDRKGVSHEREDTKDREAQMG